MRISNLSEEKETELLNNNKKKVEEPATDKNSAISKKIIKQLLNLLGTPPRLRRVEVKKVGVNVYRVNVVCPDYKKGSYIVSSQRPHSYFVTVSKSENDNEVIKFDPPIIRTYNL